MGLNIKGLNKLRCAYDDIVYVCVRIKDVETGKFILVQNEMGLYVYPSMVCTDKDYFNTAQHIIRAFCWYKYDINTLKYHGVFHDHAKNIAIFTYEGREFGEQEGFLHDISPFIEEERILLRVCAYIG